MRRRSEGFELILGGLAFCIFFFLKNMFEGLFYSFLVKQLQQYSGTTEAEVIARLSEVSFSLIGAIVTAVLMYRYIASNLRREFEAEDDARSSLDIEFDPENIDECRLRGQSWKQFRMRIRNGRERQSTIAKAELNLSSAYLRKAQTHMLRKCRSPGLCKEIRIERIYKTGRGCRSM